MRNPTPLKLFKCPGQLGLFDVDYSPEGPDYYLLDVEPAEVREKSLRFVVTTEGGTRPLWVPKSIARVAVLNGANVRAIPKWFVVKNALLDVIELSPIPDGITPV